MVIVGVCLQFIQDESYNIYNTFFYNWVVTPPKVAQKESKKTSHSQFVPNSIEHICFLKRILEAEQLVAWMSVDINVEHYLLSMYPPSSDKGDVR